MEAVLGAVCVILALLQAALVVFLVKYVSDAEERAAAAHATLLDAIASRDEQLFAHLRVMADQLVEERKAQRQELQNLFNRIQAPETAVATTVDVEPGITDYIDDERMVALENAAN